MKILKSKCETYEVVILNMRREQPRNRSVDFRIDRSSPLGNPFYMKDERYRDDVCEQYIRWFIPRSTKTAFKPAQDELKRLLVALEQHKKIRLYCWCEPKRCHAETIAEYLLENVKVR